MGQQFFHLQARCILDSGQSDIFQIMFIRVIQLIHLLFRQALKLVQSHGISELEALGHGSLILQL
jgi:hypothetical protein